MNERPFCDPNTKPMEQALRSTLGKAYAYYQKALSLADSYSRDWAFSKSSGWMLKVYDRKKALFYLIPLKSAFKISLTLRETEREEFLGDEELKLLRDQLLSSKKYSEGYAMQFEIKGEAEYKPFDVLLKKLSRMRG